MENRYFKGNPINNKAIAKIQSLFFVLPIKTEYDMRVRITM